VVGVFDGWKPHNGAFYLINVPNNGFDLKVKKDNEISVRLPPVNHDPAL